MLFLLALPVFAAVAIVHRHLQLYAPTNRLVWRVRAATPRLRNAAALVILASVLLYGMHVVAQAIVAGAPGWLNVVVLLLGWDSIKIGAAAGHVAIRCLWCCARRVASRSGARTKVTSACRVA